MAQFRVKDLMVPLEEYATVPTGSTLMDAMMALEKAQEEFIHNKHRHRGIVITDTEKGVNINEEAWQQTLATGRAHYWSRSRISCG